MADPQKAFTDVHGESLETDQLTDARLHRRLTIYGAKINRTERAGFGNMVDVGLDLSDARIVWEDAEQGEDG